MIRARDNFFVAADASGARDAKSYTNSVYTVRVAVIGVYFGGETITGIDRHFPASCCCAAIDPAPTKPCRCAQRAL